MVGKSDCDDAAPTTEAAAISKEAMVKDFILGVCV